MSKKKPTLNVYDVMEFHRGKWIPLKSTDKEGKEKAKTVSISAETAAVMNTDAKSDMKMSKKTKHFMYVLREEKDEFPSYTEQKVILKEAGIPFAGNINKKDLLAVYKEYLAGLEDK